MANIYFLFIINSAFCYILTPKPTGAHWPKRNPEFTLWYFNCRHCSQEAAKKCVCCSVLFNFCAPPLPCAILVLMFSGFVLQRLILQKPEKLRTQNVIREGIGLKLSFFFKCQEQFRAMNTLGHEVILVYNENNLSDYDMSIYIKRKGMSLTDTTSNS